MPERIVKKQHKTSKLLPGIEFTWLGNDRWAVIQHTIARSLYHAPRHEEKQIFSIRGESNAPVAILVRRYKDQIKQR